MRFDVIDRCPVPLKLAPLVRKVKADTGAILSSCDRSREAEPLLRRFGKSSQRQLWECWLARRPGCNPANPPGFSTHERRNDGVAYARPRGARLPWWAVGMDWTNASAVVRAFNKYGWAAITYPGNPREGHHVNLRRKPRTRLMRRLRLIWGPMLKRGSKGRRVRRLIGQLKFLGHLPRDFRPKLEGRRPRRKVVYDWRVERAVREFQKLHFQKADGIVGPQSQLQLRAMVRRRKRRLANR